MIFEMYAEGAPGLRLWLCGSCGRVAHHTAGAPMPAHCCHGWVARDGLCLECGERRVS